MRETDSDRRYQTLGFVFGQVCALLLMVGAFLQACYVLAIFPQDFRLGHLIVNAAMLWVLLIGKAIIKRGFPSVAPSVRLTKIAWHTSRVADVVLVSAMGLWVARSGVIPPREAAFVLGMGGAALGILTLAQFGRALHRGLLLGESVPGPVPFVLRVCLPSLAPLMLTVLWIVLAAHIDGRLAGVGSVVALLVLGTVGLVKVTVRDMSRAEVREPARPTVQRA